MSKKLRLRIRIVSLGMLIASLLLSGCAGFRLHDESKAIVTAGVKEKYTKADVLGVIDVEKKNLDNLLTEELKIVRDNSTLQVDFALLSIANDNTPMADTLNEATDRLHELGYQHDFKELRGSLLEDVDLAVGKKKMQEFSDLINNSTHVKPPACRFSEPLPDKMTFPESLSQEVREGADNFYHQYHDTCVKLQKNKRAELYGQIKQAFEEWYGANDALKTKDLDIEGAKKRLKDAQDAYNQAVEALNKAKESGGELEKDLRGKAESLEKELESAKDVLKSVEALKVPEERLNAITTLLTAAAGGEISTKDPKINKAANIAKEIPSLAGDIRGLLEQAKTPSVSNLLIEMRHQVLLLQYANQLRGLAQERVDILKTKYGALKREAGYWLEFGDALCSFAVLSDNKPFPGQKCDDFKVETKDGKTTCYLDKTEIGDCALGKPWNMNIRATSKAGATRELYKAIAAYLRALDVQAKPAEQDFRLIDVRHRETLAARQSAVQGWDNLVAVPIDQLSAFYQAGLKPAEIADLIVKALGFTAIAIGVSK